MYLKLIIAITSFLIVLSVDATAQTKEATIAWISEKLNKTLPKDPNWETAEVSAATNMILKHVDECSVVLLEQHANYREINGINTRVKLNLTIEIPIRGMTIDVHSFRHANSVIKINGYEDLQNGVRRMVDTRTNVVEFSGYNQIVWKALARMDFEQNLVNRMQTAINHLSTFCPVKKETF